MGRPFWENIHKSKRPELYPVSFCVGRDVCERVRHLFALAIFPRPLQFSPWWKNKMAAVTCKEIGLKMGTESPFQYLLIAGIYSSGACPVHVPLYNDVSVFCSGIRQRSITCNQISFLSQLDHTFPNYNPS